MWILSGCHLHPTAVISCEPILASCRHWSASCVRAHCPQGTILFVRRHCLAALVLCQPLALSRNCSASLAWHRWLEQARRSDTHRLRTEKRKSQAQAPLTTCMEFRHECQTMIPCISSSACQFRIVGEVFLGSAPSRLDLACVLAPRRHQLLT